MGSGQVWYGLRIACIIFYTLSYLALIIFSGLAAQGPIEGLFNSSTSKISNTHELWVTPPGITFSIWGWIYFFFAATVIYNISLIFRKDAAGERMYVGSPTAYPAYCVIMGLSFLVAIVWCFMWDRVDMISGAYALPLTAYLAYTATFFLSRELYRRRNDYSGKEWTAMIVIVQNGSAMYTTWVTIASILQVSIAFKFSGGAVFAQLIPVNETISMIALGTVVLGLMIWLPMDSFALDNYVRYCISPHIVLLWAFGGICGRRYGSDTEEVTRKIQDYILTLTLTIAVVTMIRIVLLVAKFYKKPLRSATE